MPDEADRLRAVERWFYRRGLPFFVEDYQSATAVWTRATPFLAVVFVVLVVGAALSFENAGGAVAAFVVTIALGIGYGAANRRRGSCWWSIPRRVSWPVLAGFVLVPTAVTFAASLDASVALDTAALAAVMLLLAWVVTRFAIVPLCGWAVRYTLRGFNDLYRLATRALPMMLLFITFLFLTTELWQVAGSLSAARLWLVVMLFGVLGVGFIIGRVPQEIDLIESATTRDQVVVACAGTPLADVVDALPGLDAPVDLTRRQRANIGLVMTVAQLVQVTLFAVVVWLFFVVFGALTVSTTVQASWMGSVSPIDVVWSWGSGFGVTRQLLRVSLFIGAFSGFYVTIYTAIDAVYREQFYDRIREDLERSLSVRRAYVALRRRP
ncbi:MAG: hypothetical protein IPO93_16500 [Actinobacteria bacterium]|nr:hypothetical protein [Actinomycetota bacterium]